MLTFSGCANPKPDTSSANNTSSNTVTAPPKKTEALAVAMGPANNTRTITVTSKNGEQVREKLWTVEWQSANLAIVNGKQSGDMFKVRGSIFDKETVSSTFFADHAEADKAVDRLILDGGIKITSERSKAKLTAKKVEWFAYIKLFKASGDVMLDTKDGVVGPQDVMYTDAKLTKVASSQEYFKQ
jgi:hypothetical protein